jgi:glucose-6-phosphate isomerase
MAFASINPQHTQAWKNLCEYYNDIKDKKIKTFFETNPSRFEQYSVLFDDILFDYSKNLVDNDGMALLFSLAKECKLNEAIEAMFNGEKINQTENRAVLHTALRNFSGKPAVSNGQDVMPDVQKVLLQMKSHQTYNTAYSYVLH